MTTISHAEELSPRATAATAGRARTGWSDRAVSWLQVAPLVLVLVLFFGVPMAIVLAVSFMDYGLGEIYPEFVTFNYAELFESSLTVDLYLNTIKFALITWAATLIIGFNVAYFLVFHVRTLIWQIALFLLCTVPFWTSNIVRMISWIPFLGREGLFNQALMGAGLIDEPLEFLLFSDFAVVIAYIHLFTLFMVVPIFNSMARIDRALLEAAYDAGAGRFRTVFEVILPLSKTGIALGSIFVIALVMGDFFVVKTMSGGQSASVVSALSNEIAGLQYPPAAASAVVLIVMVSLMIAGILRIVDIRKELAN